MSGKEYNEDICLGISFENTENGMYNYSLYFNTSGMQDEIPDTLLPETINYKTEYKDVYYDPWIKSGFLTI